MIFLLVVDRIRFTTVQLKKSKSQYCYDFLGGKFWRHAGGQVTTVETKG